MSNPVVEKISARAESIISGQIDSYRAIQRKAGVILSAISIFLALFSLTPKTSIPELELLKILAFLAAGFASILMLTVLVHRKIKDGMGHHIFNDLINKEETDFYVEEIGISMTCIRDNDISLTKLNKTYNLGLISFLTALMIIILIFSINSFKSFVNMADDDKKETTQQKDDKPQELKLNYEDSSKTRHIVGMQTEDTTKSKKKDEN